MLKGNNERSNVLIYGTTQYSTLDDVPVDGQWFTSPQDYIAVPTGWIRVAYSLEIVNYVIATHYWSTAKIVFSNGDAYHTFSANRTYPGSAYCKNRLDDSIYTYKSKNDNEQIILSSNSLTFI